MVFKMNGLSDKVTEFVNIHSICSNWSVRMRGQLIWRSTVQKRLLAKVIVKRGMYWVFVWFGLAKLSWRTCTNFDRQHQTFFSLCLSVVVSHVRLIYSVFLPDRQAKSDKNKTWKYIYERIKFRLREYLLFLSLNEVSGLDNGLWMSRLN